MSITTGQVVSIAYTLRDDEGDILDQSPATDPLVYLHGHRNLIPGVEEALDGQDTGAELTIVVPPEKAYGGHDPALDLALSLSEHFPDDQHDAVEAGVRFQGPHPDPERPDEAILYTVHGVDGDTVYASGNHPLAGQTLHFEIEVVGVRGATTEELAHGHVHPDGGSCS